MSVARSVGRWLLGLGVIALLGLAACGYSEDEMRAKQREVDDANAHIEQLKAQLQAKGIDYAKLSKDAEEQARALEEYKKRAAQLEEIKRRFELLRNKLQKLTELGLNVTVRNNRMVIQLPGDVLFDTGRDTLKKKGEEILSQVAAVVRGDADLSKRHFQVAGHTDSTPLRAGAYKDNWGLSVMRAREVLAFLIKAEAEGGGGLNAKHWSAAGYGDTDPTDPNDTVKGREKNRRCELVVVPNVEEMLDLNALVK
jgi:chemotaxis protein MotB